MASLAPAFSALPARAASLGTVLDYSAGVPSAAAVKAAGHVGAVRYVSQRRPGAEWMKGKPVSLAEATDFKAAGLATASVYQFGKNDTADWRRGAAGVATHAPQAIALHVAAGGPTGRPIYVAIDDNPSRAEYESLIRPYLTGFSAVLSAAGFQTGVYANYNTIEWCTQDHIGTFFWMHDWGSGGRVHQRANLHQVSGRRATIEGTECDVNDVLTADWGQWTPGRSASTAPSGTVSQADQVAQAAQASSVAVNAARAVLGL
nr:DUF1906 domain-containing protein [Corynebacterium capitovis]